MINISIQRDTVISEAARVSQYIEVTQREKNNLNIKSCCKDDLPLLKHVWAEVCGALLSHLQPFTQDTALSETQFQINLLPANVRINRQDSDFVDALTPVLSGLCQNYLIHAMLSRWYDNIDNSLSLLQSNRSDSILARIVQILRNAPHTPLRRSQPPI